MNYQVIIIPIVAAVLAQIAKLIISAVKHQFSWKELFSYGGMPSSHAALVFSLALMAGLADGWDSTIFAIAVVFGIIIIRDAAGLRRVVGKQSHAINELVHKLPAVSSDEFNYLNERIGHTPLELFYGCLIGLGIVLAHVIIF
ncbi:MAG: divergent PAP2 family protein [Parcubacteria group bacterium]